MVLNVHPKKYSFIDLVFIKDDNMAFHFTLDWHPLGQNFMFSFAKAQSALSSPHQFLIPKLSTETEIEHEELIVMMVFL